MAALLPPAQPPFDFAGEPLVPAQPVELGTERLHGALAWLARCVQERGVAERAGGPPIVAKRWTLVAWWPAGGQLREASRAGRSGGGGSPGRGPKCGATVVPRFVLNLRAPGPDSGGKVGSGVTAPRRAVERPPWAPLPGLATRRREAPALASGAAPLGLLGRRVAAPARHATARPGACALWAGGTPDSGSRSRVRPAPNAATRAAARSHSRCSCGPRIPCCLEAARRPQSARGAPCRVKWRHLPANVAQVEAAVEENLNDSTMRTRSRR